MDKLTKEEIAALTERYNLIQESYKILVANVKADNSQTECIEFLSDFRKIDADILKEAGVFFNENVDEAYYLCGQDENTLYNLSLSNKTLNYTGRFMLPLLNMKNELVCWIGYDYESDAKYLIGLLGVGDKRHLIYGVNDIERAFEESTIIVTEGFFERLRLKEIGLNVGVSLVGKKMSDWHKMFLNQFDNVILIPDGDAEGQAAIPQWLSGLTSNICVLHLIEREKTFDYGEGELVTKSAKDLDDLLRDEPEKASEFHALYEEIKQKLKTTAYYETSFS